MKRKMVLFLVAAMMTAATIGGSQMTFAQEVEGTSYEAKNYQDAAVYIYTAADLAAYSGGEMRENYVLMNDIDLSAYAGGVYGINVYGSFNGNGHIIYGIQGENALFGNNYGTISNLTVEGDMQINSSSFRIVAGIAEYNIGVIEDCVNRVNMNSYGVNIRMAGITAYNDGSIYRCKNEGTLSGKASELAGVTALNGGANIVDCENSGDISFKTTDCHAYVGGIVGNETRSSSGSQFTIENCKNTGNIHADTGNVGSTIGGIIGEAARKGDDSTSIIRNCTNAGNISGNGEVGGVIGYINHGQTYRLNGEEIISNSDNFQIEGCGNSGTITTIKSAGGVSSWAGGVFGKVNIKKNGTVYIKDCGNSGSIYSENGNSETNIDVLGGIGATLDNMGNAYGVAQSYIYVESCYNRGYVDSSVNYYSDQIAGTYGGNIAVTKCDYTGNRFKTDADGTVHAFYTDGTPIINQFIFDGFFTYYIQADGTAMKDNLTYHPDGTHIICFDDNGHEVFMDFYYCSKVGYTCYFDSLGYIYKDQITFVGNKTYYLKGNGKMENSGWFQFANGLDYGYANSDGTLKTNQFSYDAWGRVVFYHWNGMVARGLITDGVYYYNMDTTDGHYLGSFPVN